MNLNGTHGLVRPGQAVECPLTQVVQRAAVGVTHKS
jgi:hypothetical protein